MRTIKTEVYQCSVCEKLFLDATQCQKHEQRHDSNTYGKALKRLCNISSRRFFGYQVYSPDYMTVQDVLDNFDDVLIVLNGSGSGNFLHWKRNLIHDFHIAYTTGLCDKSYYDKIIKALENATHPMIQTELARYGHYSEKYARSAGVSVKLVVVETGKCLDILVTDPNKAVRKAVARQGYGLDILKNDSDPDVRYACELYYKDCERAKKREEKYRERMEKRNK